MSNHERSITRLEELRKNVRANKDNKVDVAGLNLLSRNCGKTE